jgi:phage gp46-like protein
MKDIQLRWSTEGMEGVVAFDPETNDLVQDDGLGTAVIISLFTDARAREDDVLPGNLTPGTFQDRRGWWGDLTSEKENDSVGSRLWLLERSKDIEEMLPQVKRLSEEALQWMIDEGIAAKIEVTVEAVE